MIRVAGSSWLPFFVLTILELHLLRNVSSFYLVFYGLAFFLSVWYLYFSWSGMRGVDKQLLFIIILIFFFPLIGTLYGVLVGSYGDYGVLIGWARIIFCLPIYLVILAMPPTEETLRKLFVFAVLITCFSALSYPYQFFYGGVSWFAEPSMRDGVVRYASLFGSLTAYGIVCGYAALLTLVVSNNRLVKVTVLLIITLGAVLSLQKAALANIAMAFILWLWIGRRYGVFFLICLLSLGVGSFLLDADKVATIMQGEFGATLMNDALARVSELPLIAIDFFGSDSLLLGLGPLGASGSLGYPEVPMAHNAYVSMLLVAGLPYLLLFGVLFLFLFLIKIGMRSVHGRLGMGLLFMLLVNMLFAGIPWFVPAPALFLAIAIKCVTVPYKEKRVLTDPVDYNSV